MPNKEPKINEERIPSPKIEGPPAFINIVAGGTINVGNYSSAKVSVSLTYPCSPEDIDFIYPKVKAWVDKRVGEEMSEIKAYVENNKVSI